MEEKAKVLPSYLIESSIECYLHGISGRRRAIYWIVLLIITGTLLSLPFIYVDITVRASGVIQSNIEKQAIVAVAGGKVIHANLNNNAVVNAGDTILIIDTLPVITRILAIEYALNENSGFEKDLLQILQLDFDQERIDISTLLTSRYIREVDNLQRQLLTIRNRIDRLQREDERSKVMFENHHIAQVELQSTTLNRRMLVLLKRGIIHPLINQKLRQ